MNKNAKQITTIAILIAITSSIATYAWNNQTLSEMVEEHNQQILSDCLTKARVQKTAKEILEYASNCNQDILTNISTPRSVETITWTHSTGNTVPPLWFQIIPQASAKESSVANVTNVADLQKKNIQEWSIQNKTENYSLSGSKVRTPKQLYDQVKHLGYREAPAVSLIQSCKASSLRPDHCIIVWLVLMYNEAGNQQNSKACIDRNNCFGIQSGKKSYTSLDEWMENFVQKYNKYWYKANWAWFFYSSAWKVSPSRYCTSEDSSKSSVGCPMWLLVASQKWSQLEKIIYLK